MTGPLSPPVAELGETDDPTRLIPGNPNAVRQTARDLAHTGANLTTAGEQLARINAGDWTGTAADSFHAAFKPEPNRWLTGGLAMDAASDALASYADVLHWAQQQAGEAIALWIRPKRTRSGRRPTTPKPSDTLSEQCASIPASSDGSSTRSSSTQVRRSAKSPRTS